MTRSTRTLVALAATVVTAAAAASAPARAATTAAGAAASTATMPTCKAGDPVVWENTGGKKVYHLAGDRYFGKTKRGAYACASDATAAGFHAAKAAGAGTPAAGADGGAMGAGGATATPVPSADASPTPRRHHRRHRGGSDLASPAPTPAAT